MSVMDGRFAVCRSESRSEPPAPDGAAFFSMTRTADELSIVCPESDAPEGAKVESGWRAIKVEGTLDFSLTGILTSISAPLAEAGIPLFAVSTFDTDYILVKEETFERAKSALSEAGHEFVFAAPTIRPATPKDEDFMRRMLAVAARAEDGEAALEDPSISRYLDEWGRDGDIGFIAEDVSGESLGAAWARLFPLENPGYGFAGEEIPELAVGVLSDARGRGVGRTLIEAVIFGAEGRHPALSLSVREDNPAIRLYRRLGFEALDGGDGANRAGGTSLTMKLDLR